MVREDNAVDEMSAWAYKQYLDKYAWKEHGKAVETRWSQTAYRVVKNVLGALGYGDEDREFQTALRLVTERKFMPGGRYLAMAGRDWHPINNCFLMRAEDSREGWAELVRRSILALTGGGGVGVVYSDIRPYGSEISTTGGFATGPLSPANMINEVARHVMAGGQRRSALWGGLHWRHPDIMNWITAKNWSDELKMAKAKDYNSPAPLDMTNISVILDDDFFTAYHNPMHIWHRQASTVYWAVIHGMLTSGEPGFSVNIGENVDECLRNPCCEVTSTDDSDVCCLGSVNLSRIRDLDEMALTVEIGVLFLLAGTVYSDVPYEKVAEVRAKNRRIGLGLMGVHEWLLARGYDYSVVPELKQWLEIYAQSGIAAEQWAYKHDLNVPVKTRAIAPTGTIGTIAETTTGIEPIFCVAFKRRFLDSDGQWRYQYVIDPTTQRLHESIGIDPDAIEDAYSLSYDVEKRIRFQRDIEQYVDMAVSSTINLPAVSQNPREFGDILMKYLPELRGITVYPDGARAGQPLSVVSYSHAIKHVGVSFEENIERCAGGVCGL